MDFSNRRNSTRHMPVHETARVGWWQGSEFHCAPARLRDLSQGGAAVAVNDSAPGAGAVWVCLAGPVMTG